MSAAYTPEPAPQLPAAPEPTAGAERECAGGVPRERGGGEPTPAQPSACVAQVKPAGPHGIWSAAFGSLGAQARFWSIVVLGLALDLWSKSWAFQTLRQGGRRVLIPNVLEFHTTLNPGALFGIGAGRTSVFLLASVLALILVLWMFAQSHPRGWLMHLGLGAILAGALGNMYDRMFVQLVEYPARTQHFWVVAASGETASLRDYPPDPNSIGCEVPGEVAEQPVGYVRDFIKIPTRWWGHRELWPWVFNVADSLLVGGVIVLALRMLGERKEHVVATADATA